MHYLIYLSLLYSILVNSQSDLPSSTDNSSINTTLPNGSLSQFSRLGRPDHCLPIPNTTVPFCQSIVANKWISLPKEAIVNGVVAQSVMLSMDTYARSAVMNWTQTLRGYDCRVNDDDSNVVFRRYSMFRNCDDCAHAYRYWLCNVIFPECVSTSLLANPPNITITTPIKRILPNNSIWITAMQFLGSSMAVNATLDIPDRLLNPINSTEILNVSSPPLSPIPITNELISNTTTTYRSHPELMSNSSMVDEFPYKPPCLSICHRVVQACPSIFQFLCPRDFEESWDNIIHPESLHSVDEIFEPDHVTDNRSIKFPDYNPLC